MERLFNELMQGVKKCVMSEKQLRREDKCSLVNMAFL